MTLCVFDTETSGVAPGSAIVELAAVILHGDDEFHYRELMAPGCPIPPGASAVHGIYNHHVDHLPPAEEVVPAWWREVSALHESSDDAEPLILSGHNTAFDLRMIARYVQLPKVLTLCTLKLSRKLFPDAPNHKLGTMFDYLGLTGEYNAHSALDDCEMTRDILKAICEYTGKGYHQLALEQSQPQRLEIMPFGKHRGTPIKALPPSYLRFMLGLPDLDPDVRHSMNLALGRQ